MADVTSDGAAGAEQLLRRLQRLTIHAEAADLNDRATIIALLDDVDTLRRRLLHECARLDDDLRRATVRVTAISAYARGAQSARAPLRRGN
ncbi:MAG: hypothetical protein ACXVIQ_12720 [Ilumatobacteraceae bacterium]